MGRLNLKRIDPELVSIIIDINEHGSFRTVASCSGHRHYHPTIVLKSKFGNYLEFYSGVYLQPTKRRYLCFYQRDNEGRFFIPQVEDFYKKQEDVRK